jgi:hypothetical protein
MNHCEASVILAVINKYYGMQEKVRGIYGSSSGGLTKLLFMETTRAGHF